MGHLFLQVALQHRGGQARFYLLRHQHHLGLFNYRGFIPCQTFRKCQGEKHPLPYWILLLRLDLFIG